MRSVLTIVRREYVETVKTKAFLIGIFMTPVLMAGVFLLAGRVEKIVTGPGPAKHVAVTDLSGQIEPRLRDLFDEHNKARPDRQTLATFFDAESYEDKREELEADVRSGDLDGWLVIAADVLDGPGACEFYTGKSVDLMLLRNVESHLNRAVTRARFELHDLDYERVERLLQSASLQHVDVGSKEKRKREPIVSLMAPFFFMFLMFMGVFGTNQQMLTSVIEEKNSRVIEVLLSAVTPRTLMIGKILGLGAVGLTVVCIWGSAAYAAATLKGVTGMLSPSSFLYFAVYYVLGFLLFSAIFAAVGSACNSLKEAQSLVAPLTFVLIIPVIAWMPISQRPDSAFAVTLSFIPPLTPMVMVLRLAAAPHVSVLQIAGSILVLALSVVITMHVAGKVFETGILMYGKPASVREILRWITYKPRE